jgi:acyl carrier protein
MNQILDILAEIRPDCDFASSNDFINDCLLDSFDVITLTSELESRFNITINTGDVVPENYMSVNSITALVQMRGGKLSDDV